MVSTEFVHKLTVDADVLRVVKPLVDCAGCEVHDEGHLLHLFFARPLVVRKARPVLLTSPQNMLHSRYCAQDAQRKMLWCYMVVLAARSSRIILRIRAIRPPSCFVSPADSGVLL